MKTIAQLLLSLSLILVTTNGLIAGEGENSQANWLHNIKKKKKIAAEENKDILISFSGSDWCIPCMRLEKELFQSETFKNYSDENLVLLKLDFPAKKKNELPEAQLKHNESLAEIYNKKGIFPKVVIVNANGELKGLMEHPKSNASAYIESIDKIINK